MKRPATVAAILGAAMGAMACGGRGHRGGFEDFSFLPHGSDLPDCPPSALSFVISSGRLRTFEDPGAIPLAALVRVGEGVDLFTYPRVSGGTCNSSFGPVRAWTSADPTVAEVVPLSEGSSGATLTGRSPGDTVIGAEVLYPERPAAGTLPSVHRARQMYYCCPPANCPSAPPQCTYIPIDRVRVVPE